MDKLDHALELHLHLTLLDLQADVRGCKAQIATVMNKEAANCALCRTQAPDN